MIISSGATYAFPSYMGKFLILFATAYGQTEKIASAIENRLLRSGHSVDLYNCKELPPYLRVEDYSGVIIGAPVYAGGFSRTLRKWVRKNSEHLAKVPTSFYSVSLGILQKEEMVQKAQRDSSKTFFETTHWQPKQQVFFAGALAYSQYNWLLRGFMKSIARRAGGDTDTSRDYEYTNWGDVERFADEFVRYAITPESVDLGSMSA